MMVIIRNFIISHVHSSSMSHPDISLKRNLVEEGCSFKWQTFLNIEVLIKYLIVSKYEREWSSGAINSSFVSRWNICLKRHLVEENAILNDTSFLILKSPLRTYFYLNMSVNEGQ